ncbi:AMP-binding protein [Amycolatopsis pigmentata]|uniref:AMP-binding protein n=1 Tax=Amycolatopsis pigmentata TaxID=450801 RepID=A0ABW5G490_9PSEU
MAESSLFLTRILDVLCDGGDEIAFAHGSAAVTYRDAYEALRRLHGLLKSEGVAPGDLVAITGGNMPETILLQIAAQLRGARVAHVECPGALGGLNPDHVVSADPEDPLVLGRRKSAPAGADEEDSVLPRSVETLFPADEGLVSYRDEYEEFARTCAAHPDGPRRVLLIAPMSHPIGNRITCKALLSGDTVVLHSPETPATQVGEPSVPMREPSAGVARVPCAGRRVQRQARPLPDNPKPAR